jgi:hypothetical protein
MHRQAWLDSDSAYLNVTIKMCQQSEHSG